MSGSQRCKHAWLAGREVVEVSASVRRTLECSQDSVACLLSESMEIGSLYGFSGSSRDMRTAGRLNFATNRRKASSQAFSGILRSLLRFARSRSRDALDVL